MVVRKRNGSLEPINLNKIVRAVSRSAVNLSGVDANRVASKTIGALYNEASTQELDWLSIETAASLIPEHEDYSKLAAALLSEFIRKEVVGQGIESFSQSVLTITRLGLTLDPGIGLVQANARKLDNAIDDAYNANFEYFGLRNVYDHYLLRHPETNKAIETPQQFFMRIAVSQSVSAKDAVKAYRSIALLESSADLEALIHPKPPVTVTLPEEEPVYERSLMPGMGQAVAERTILRKDANGKWETWGDVAHRVAVGNSLLASTPAHPSESERRLLQRHIAKGNTLMSGRHLQHGDETQPSRNMEVFTNCLDGSTRILTMEYGPKDLATLAGQTVHVISADGSPRPATIHAHGQQEVFDVVFRANSSGGKFRRNVLTTANHRWFLRSGEVTDHLQVGDVLKSTSAEPKHDSIAVIHGLIYGDGSAHKSRNDSYRRGVSQGRTYAAIRVCKEDAVRETIHDLLDDAGYTFTTPPHANGDRVYYIGKLPHAKDLPFTNDPTYIAGFLHGWWLADGSKGIASAMEISTASEEAAAWLDEYAGYAGYSLTMHCTQQRIPGDGSYANGKSLHIIRLRLGVEWKVDSITSVGVRPVFCPEEPVTTGFVLANGLLTGNCSTAATSFLSFYLLLNGSGIGRCYDDDMMLVNWDNAPNLRCVLDAHHPNFTWGVHESRQDAQHKYGAPVNIRWFIPPTDHKDWAAYIAEWEATAPNTTPQATGSNVLWFQVPDSREGWAKALELWEFLAYEKAHKDTLLLLDFTPVRPKNTPIGGMQSRPASGPAPLMSAFTSAASLKGAGLPLWKQAMYVDHYFAECVLVGGARRAARMSTKYWRDRSVLDFITVKRPLEFYGKGVAEITQLRKDALTPPQGFLWSSNNSIAVDGEFWEFVHSDAPVEQQSEDERHAKAVFALSSAAAYGDGTGEPGLLNVHKFVQKDKGLTEMLKTEFVGSPKYRLNEETQLLLVRLAKKAKAKKYHMICNPCVTSDTWVLTSAGPRQVSELIDTPYVAVVNGKEYPATGFWKTGEKQVFKVTTNRGYSIRATANHKLCVERQRHSKSQGGYHQETEWVEIANLRVGDRLVLNDQSQTTLVADPKNTEFRKGWDVAGDILHSDSSHASLELEKQSPSFILGFLRRVFDTYGVVQGSSICLAQSGVVALEMIQRMLSRLGILTTLRLNRRKAQHELVITGDNIARFAAIGFHDTAKAESLARILGNRKRALNREKCTTEVLSITADGVEPVYDCTVDTVHCFDANGLLAHNCGEIVLFLLGAFCVIADFVPFHCDTLDEAEECIRVITRALMRVNLMESIYSKEVKRTNRIGIGITGVHEFAWKFFGYGFLDLIDEQKSLDFWLTMARFNRAVADEAKSYAAELGVEVPHTTMTVKPAGCRPWYGLVTTDQGLLTLQDMFADHPDDSTWGDIPYAVNAIQDEGESQPITRTYANGRAEVMQVRLAYGLCVDSTRNHPWWVKATHAHGQFTPVNQWVRTEDLVPGMVLDVKVGVYTKTSHAKLHPLSTLALRMRRDNNPILQPKELNPDLAWFLGYLWGDGGMSPENFQFRWTDQRGVNLQKMNRIFQEQFGIEGTITPLETKDACTLEIGNKELWHWLIRNGVYKYHADTIDIIPRVVRESAQEDILAFLAGLLDSDGAINVTSRDKTVTFTQADYRLSRHVQDVAWAVGIALGMSHNTVGESFNKAGRSMYLLTGSTASSLGALELMSKHSTKMASAPTHVPWRHEYEGRPIRRILGKVESVTSLGEMDTFDVEVPSNQWFYAGAVRSHNTTSKLFGLTEGWHLTAMDFWLRWVQFRSDDPQIQQYRSNGYPIRELKQYAGTTIVGFPTCGAIAGLGMGDKLMTAGQATPEQQFQWIMLGEKYWIHGTDAMGTPVADQLGNQISYCLAGGGEHLVATSKGMFHIEDLANMEVESEEVSA